jgi:hypothetical protein
LLKRIFGIDDELMDPHPIGLGCNFRGYLEIATYFDFPAGYG